MKRNLQVAMRRQSLPMEGTDCRRAWSFYPS